MHYLEAEMAVQLAGSFAQQALSSLIVFEKPPVRIDQSDGIIDCVKGPAPLPPALPQRLLCPLAVILLLLEGFAHLVKNLCQLTNFTFMMR